jgi:hypothetical protein
MFIIDLLTNNVPSDNSLVILNSALDTVYKRLPDDLKPATNYLDTLNLKEDNYAMILSDKAGDGLEFWFQPESGFGRLRLKDLDGNIIHLFESDCGNGQLYSFKCESDAIVDTSIVQLSVNIYPRMVSDSISIYTTTNRTSFLKIKITKDGKFIEDYKFSNIRDSITDIDLSHLDMGRYVMEIYINGEHKMNRRFNKI